MLFHRPIVADESDDTLSATQSRRVSLRSHPTQGEPGRLGNRVPKDYGKLLDTGPTSASGPPVRPEDADTAR